MNYRYKNIELELADDVYHPSEDSELLAEMLAGRIEPGMSILDMGCGSGLLTILAAKAGAKVTAVDRNPSAIRLTEMNAQTNGVKIECVVSDLFQRINERFDLIIFNPPYLPDNDEVEGSEMWSKRDVIERFIGQLDKHLKLEGFVLMLVSSLTPTKEVIELLVKNGFNAQVIAERKVPWEMLAVISARR